MCARWMGRSRNQTRGTERSGNAVRLRGSQGRGKEGQEVGAKAISDRTPNGVNPHSTHARCYGPHIRQSSCDVCCSSVACACCCCWLRVECPRRFENIS